MAIEIVSFHKAFSNAKERHNRADRDNLTNNDVLGV